MITSRIPAGGVRAGCRPRARRRSTGACAHAFGYRGHCLTKSRRYSTTFKALREARERYVHEQLLARTDDLAQGALAGAVERVASFRYVGQGHLTAADELLAGSAAARAREHRRLAREELGFQAQQANWSSERGIERLELPSGGRTGGEVWS